MITLAIINVLGEKESIPKMFSRFLVKKPLFLYICESALKSKNIDDVYIFTEDENIAHIAEIKKINVIKKSDIIKKDFQNIDDLIVKIFDSIEIIENKKYDNLIILQPNCPLIKPETIDKIIEDFITSDFDTAISVKIREGLGPKFWKKDEKGFGIKISEYIDELKHTTTEYRERDGIFITKKDNINLKRRKFGDKVKLIELSFPESLEIKNHIDWWIAEKFLQRKRILIRVDGYNKIGLGHIFRMLSIANQLIDHNLIFVSEKKYNLGIRLIKEFNYDLETFTTHQEFEEIINNFKPNIVLNDILDTDLEYIKFLKNSNIFVVNFEDLGEGSKKSDVVINALYKRNNFLENHYWGKDYYILREEFYLIGQKKVEKKVKNILITYGGTDPNNYTKRVLDVIKDLNLKDIRVVAILGLGYKNPEKLKEYLKKLNFTVIVKQHINHISKFMYKADIAFTAAGRSVYELASIGIPTIVLVENKRGLMHTFASKENGIIKLGLGYEIFNEEIRDVLIKLIEDYELRKRCNQLMLKNNLRIGVNNVISLIFSQYEKFERGQKK